MEPLWRSLEYPMDYIGSILKAPPWDFLLANPLPHSQLDPRPQKTLSGAFNMLPRESIEYSWEPP